MPTDRHSRGGILRFEARQRAEKEAAFREMMQFKHSGPDGQERLVVAGLTIEACFALIQIIQLAATIPELERHAPDIMNMGRRFVDTLADEIAPHGTQTRAMIELGWRMG